ncbi:metallophosphoesterase family protein [Pyruvatibacter sp. HU-CL02332]|uniref:metallophosphoesterase family protein n=1 Tax=Pyruvatibacter sp. HU-CL02332 TaxID=3127650 RepID=UPI003365A470
MFKQAFSRLTSAVLPAARPAARVPEGTRVYAIGDIHGRADLLDQLHDKILEDARHAGVQRHVVVYLGDYVDRGLDSKGVIDCLLADPLPGFEKVFLKGNHEDAFLKFFLEPEFGRDWKYYGGLETLMSYGVKALPLKDEPDAFVAARDELARGFPSSHLDFLGGLRLWHEEGDFYFAHAGVRPGLPLEEQTGQDLMWIRDDFLTSDMDFGKVVVHGHTPEEQPVQRANRIGIDTGAYITGILTCAVLEESECRFIQIGA